jgi:hypothetical protein
MKKLLGTLFLTAVTIARLAHADGDDFNDNSKSTLKWGADDFLGNAVLVETNQRLEFQCPANTGDDIALRPWIRSGAAYGGDWEAQLDLAHSTTLGGADQYASFGILLSNPNDASDTILVELYHSTLGGLPARRGFRAELESNAISAGNADTGNLDVTAGALRLQFDSTNKVLRCDYDTNPADGYQWVPFASFGLLGQGGSTANVNWPIGFNQNFSFALFGLSSGISVASGQLFADNFVATGFVANTEAGHDLALTALKAPKKISLSATAPSVTKGVKVSIQNLGTQTETIADLETLAALVTLNIQSDGPCPSPTQTLLPPKKGFPVVLAPKKKLTLIYNVTYDCANDPLAGDTHFDFAYDAVVSTAPLGIATDDNPANDDCPRFPEGTDKGCAKGFGVFTDVLVK